MITPDKHDLTKLRADSFQEKYNECADVLIIVLNDLENNKKRVLNNLLRKHSKIKSWIKNNTNHYNK